MSSHLYTGTGKYFLRIDFLKEYYSFLFKLVNIKVINILIKALCLEVFTENIDIWFYTINILNCTSILAYLHIYDMSAINSVFVD